MHSLCCLVIRDGNCTSIYNQSASLYCDSLLVPVRQHRTRWVYRSPWSAENDAINTTNLVYIWWDVVHSSSLPVPFLHGFMMSSSNANIFRVTDQLCKEFTSPRWIPHTKASDVELWCFFDLRLNKRLSEQSWGWWFETLSCPLWHHCNMTML